MDKLAMTRRSMLGLLAGSAILLAADAPAWAACSCCSGNDDKEAANFEADDVAKTPECLQCGMNRKVFARSRMVVVYADGTETGVCSLNCALMDAALHPDKKVSSMLVSDYGTRTLTDASKAAWVIGGSKRGVMTPTPKWAFATQEDAGAFAKEFGGRLADFEETRSMASAEVERRIKEKGLR